MDGWACLLVPLRPNGYYFVSIGMYVFTNDEWNCVWGRKEA